MPSLGKYLKLGFKIQDDSNQIGPYPGAGQGRVRPNQTGVFQ